MAYIPKSKLKIQNTIGGELLFKISKKDYIGDFIETSNGKFYAGSDSSDLSTELILSITPTKVDFGGSSDVLKYKKINTDPFNKLKNTKTIISSRTKPTEEDYSKGWYYRFFAKRHNSNTDYIEINEETYTKITNQDGTYDHRLYELGIIQWALIGNVEGINTNNIKLQEKRFPFLKTLYPLPNEFQKKGINKLTNQPPKTFIYQYPANGSSDEGSGY